MQIALRWPIRWLQTSELTLPQQQQLPISLWRDWLLSRNLPSVNFLTPIATVII